MSEFNQNNEPKTHFLYPSEIFTSEEPYIISTLLGSCIAVCLYDTKRKVGGMNHFMVPIWNGDGLASAKYGNIAIELLIEKMEKMGSLKINLVAKIFGGASQYEYSTFSVGDKNIEIAELLLNSNKIPILAKSIGGAKGRKIYFDTVSGQITMNFIVKKS